MADVDFDDLDDGYGTAEGQGAARPARLAQLVNLAGAMASLALVIGLGVWGYKLAVRDVNGIPVIRAIEGPMRIAPDNPGGEVAAHQGLAVNDVAALGTAAPPPETLILAPRPVALTDEDAAAEDLNGAAPAAAGVADTALAPVLAPVAPIVAAEPPTGTDPDAVAKALAEAMATETEITPDPDPAMADGIALEDTANLDPANLDQASLDPLTGPMRPRQRPLALGTPATPASGETAPAAPATSEVAAAMIPVGTRLVQLGAFDTEDQARGEWVRLTNQFGTVFDGKALVVQSAESGGRTFYRLRAHGFADETDARGFCLALLEQNASCIPVEQR